MKNIFKKNQIIIAALAIMIVIAGYVNFSDKTDKKQTANESVDYDTYTGTASDNLLDGSTVTLNDDSTDEASNQTADVSEESSDEVAQNTVADAADADQSTDISDEDADDEEVAEYSVSDTGEIVSNTSEDTASKDSKETATKTDDSDAGEAVLVSTTISADYFANAKLVREQKRSVNKETLTEIMNNKNVSQEERDKAASDIAQLTKQADIENETETLLQAKGFTDAVVIISEKGTVDVIINTAKVTEQDIAQVEDIVKRQTGYDSSKIFISPVVEQE